MRRFDVVGGRTVASRIATGRCPNARKPDDKASAQSGAGRSAPGDSFLPGFRFAPTGLRWARCRRLVQRQPHQVAVVLAGIAMRRLVEGVGELPFLRFVAPLRRGVADDVVGTAGGADWRGERAARFVTFRSTGCGLSCGISPPLVLTDLVLDDFERVHQLNASQHRSWHSSASSGNCLLSN